LKKLRSRSVGGNFTAENAENAEDSAQNLHATASPAGQNSNFCALGGLGGEQAKTN
jgi:hypothetical protein